MSIFLELTLVVAFTVFVGILFAAVTPRGLTMADDAAGFPFGKKR